MSLCRRYATMGLRAFRSMVPMIVVTLALVAAVTPATVVAQSAAAVQQLMQLSPAEREQLMRQYGVSEQDVLRLLGEQGSGVGRRPPQRGPGGSSGQAGSGGIGGEDALDGGSFPGFDSMFQSSGFPLFPPAPLRMADPDDMRLDGAVDYGLRFGLATFDRGQPSLQELFSIPVPDDYVVGPGDYFIVSLYGTESAQYYLQVTRDGWIDLPTLGPVSVAGLTFAEARQVVLSRISEQKIGVNASVTLDQLKSIQLTISGEVRSPGVYVVPPLVSVVQLLSLAGGPTDIGSLRNIVLNRAGEQIRVDLYDHLLAGEAPGILGLRTGDTLHVPTVRAAAHVKGAVRRPGVYELRSGESVAELMEMAGGMTADAAPGGAVLRRFVAGGRQEIVDIDLTESGPRIGLEDGMILRVPQASGFTTDTVEVVGEVPAPGLREWRPGLMLSDLFDDLRRDVLISRADLDFGYVVRTDPLTRRISFHEFSLRALAYDGEDLRLESEDVVLVLPVPGIVAAEKQALLEAELRSDEADGDAAESGERASAGQPRRAVASPRAGVASAAGGRMPAAGRPGQPGMNQYGMFAPPGEATPEPPEPQDRLELLDPYLALLRAQTRDGSRVPQFTIAGEVQAPGTYPVTDAGTMRSALRAAGGLRESADPERAVVLRKPSALTELEVFEIPMSSLLASGGAPQLEPGDVITIGRDPSLANRLAVEVSGEVASPGRYVLPAGSTISDLIEIAGGVTPRADLRSAIFSRARLRAMESQLRERYLADIRRSLIDAQVAGDDRASAPAVLELLGQLESTLEEDADGRLQVDLPRLASGDMSAEVSLSDGDRLTIPSQTNAVSVAGQVRVPGSFAHVPGMTAKSYLELAGGLTTYSDEDSILIVRADGSVINLGKRSMLAFSRSDDVLYPGDRIVVPIDMTYINPYDLARDVIQFVYQTGIGLAAVVAAFQ